MLVGVRMEVFVHPRPSTEGPTHRCHDAYVWLASSSILPESLLFLWISEVHIGDDIEIRSGGEAFVVLTDKGLGGASLPARDLTDRVAFIS